MTETAVKKLFGTEDAGLVTGQSPAEDRSASPAAVTVPFIDLARQYAVIKDDILAAVDRVCSSQQYILGDEVSSFESEIAAFTGTAHAISCASGTDALWLSLLAAGVNPGDEVITTAFSFIATANSITRVGARPILVDVDPETLNIDPEWVELKLSESHTGRRSAIIAVHLYGQCANMDRFRSLAVDNRVAMIEDAAQALGAEWRGHRAGSLGSMAALSFYPTKNLGAYGDGGCVTTDDQRFAGHLQMLRNHGSQVRYHHDEIGWNSRLDAIQAAILKVKLQHLEQWNAARVKRAAIYERLFAAAGLHPTSRIVTLDTVNGSGFPIKLLRNRSNGYHIYHQYAIRAQRRDELREFLRQRGIATEVYYPVPIHLQKCFAYLGYNAGSLPESEKAANEVLALPMFPELREDEQKLVVNAIAEFYS